MTSSPHTVTESDTVSHPSGHAPRPPRTRQAPTKGAPLTDLYSTDLDEVPFSRLCGGGQQDEDGEGCVLIAPIPGIEDAFALRDSKNPDAGTLRFTGDELRAAGLSTL
jgi:hypothetical protein